MSNTTISPNMNLPIPVVSVDPGPDWATNVNACFTTIDGHDHASGSGVQITPAGLDISSDLAFGSNNATGLRTSRYVSQGSPLSAPDLQCTYVVGADLYYNDGAGNQVRITQGGSVTGSSGTITGLPSGTASASYSAGTFTWQSATSTPATMAVGPLVIGRQVASSKTVTLAPNAAQASNFNVTFPAALPGATNYMTLSSTGALSFNSSGSTGTGAVVLDTGATLTSASILGGSIQNSLVYFEPTNGGTQPGLGVYGDIDTGFLQSGFAGSLAFKSSVAGTMQTWDPSGAITLGSAATNNYNAPLHTVSGALVSGNQTTVDESGQFNIGANYYLGSQTANAARTQTGVTGVALVFDTRTTDTVSTLGVYVNAHANSTSTTAALAAAMTGQGAWTWGSSAGVGVSHTAQSGGLTALNVSSGGSFAQRINFQNGSTTNWTAQGLSAGDFSLQSQSITALALTQAGAATIGPSGGGVTHRLNTDTTATGGATLNLSACAPGSNRGVSLFLPININGTSYIIPLFTPT